jgi:hypothetical protein
VTEIVREQYLTDLFRNCDAECALVRVTFSDGECCDIRILSTMHAEAGGDIVAEVVQSVMSTRPHLWNKAMINLHLQDVVRVEVGDEYWFGE